MGEASFHDNFQMEKNANNATIQMQGRSSPSAENSSNSGVVLHQTPLHYLKDILPDTPHNIYIIHALRRYRDEMTHRKIHIIDQQNHTPIIKRHCGFYSNNSPYQIIFTLIK
jgi:hypothetical protein